MRRLCIVFIFSAVLLSSCKGVDSTVLSKTLSEDFSCRVNIKSESGELLFGGTLSKSGEGFEYVAEAPSELCDAKYIKKDGMTVLKIGDMSLPIKSEDLKISKIFSLLESAQSIDAPCERLRLYGADSIKMSLDKGELYFVNNKPLLLLFDGARVEITGFSYGKDDNFGYKDKESVA